MPDVAVMTDSNAGMTQEEGEKYGVEILPMSFIINGKIYYEGKDISYETFLNRLNEGAQVSTSQPAPGEVIERWEKLLKRHDEVVYIPMSGALSKSCETATLLAQEYDGRVQVVDSRRVSVPQKMMVLDALSLVKEGKNAVEIKKLLGEGAMDCAIYIAVDTLKYLKRGGRITGTAATLGTVLNIKPVLLLKGQKLDAFEKARGMKAARRIMLQAVREELEGQFRQFAERDEVCLQMAHTCIEEGMINEWEAKIREEFPHLKLYAAPLPLCTACHIGPNGLGIGITRRIRKDW